MKNYIAQSIVCCVAFILLSCVLTQNSGNMQSNIKLPGTGKELHIDLKNFTINDERLTNNGNTQIILAEQRNYNLMVLIAITKAAKSFQKNELGFGDPLESKKFYMLFFGVPTVNDKFVREYIKEKILFRKYSSYFKIYGRHAFNTIDTYIALGDYLIMVKVNQTAVKYYDYHYINRIVESISIVDAQPANQNKQQ